MTPERGEGAGRKRGKEKMNPSISMTVMMMMKKKMMMMKKQKKKK